VKDVDDMYRRLAVVSVQLEELGITHKRNVDVLLRRMSNSDEVGPLRTLVSILEPVKEYQRYQQRPATMLSPLTGLVDAATPDSVRAREFARRVDELISDSPRFQSSLVELRGMLSEWRDVGPSLLALSERSPAGAELKPLALQLGDLAGTGLEAVSYLNSGVVPPEDWAASKKLVFAEAAKPKSSAVEFAMLASIRKLVLAAVEAQHLKTMSANEWRRRVTDLSASPNQ
jgi:hexosaminidase